MKRVSILIALLIVVFISSTMVLGVSSTQQPIEYTYLMFQDQALQDSYTTKKIPELLKAKGFNIKFKMIPLGTHDANEWTQKFQLRVASGEKPADIIHSNGLQPTAITARWYAELKMNTLKKLIPEYMTEVERVYPKMWAMAKDPTTGKLYGIPSFNVFGPNRHAMAIRTDWLKKLDMKIPETIEDFEAWLRAVRKTDFDGDGQFNHYGYTSQNDLIIVGFPEVFGAFNTMPGMWLIRNGKPVRGEVLPEAKQGLALLRKWYAEDLLPKGIMTTVRKDDDWNAGLVGTNGQPGAYAPNAVPGLSFEKSLKDRNPDATFEVIKSPKGPKGVYGAWGWGPRKYTLSFGKHLEKDKKKLETIIKAFYSIALDRELFETATFGQKNLHWEFRNKEANSGPIVFKEPWVDQNRKWEEVGVRELSESVFAPFWIEAIYKNYMDPKALAIGKLHTQYFDQIGMNLPSDPQYKNDLLNLTKAAYYEIITGKKPLDYFDEYVKTWYTKGGTAQTKEATDIYNRVIK